MLQTEERLKIKLTRQLALVFSQLNEINLEDKMPQKIPEETLTGRAIAS